MAHEFLSDEWFDAVEALGPPPPATGPDPGPINLVVTRPEGDVELHLANGAMGRGLHDVIPIQLSGALANEELTAEELREIVILIAHYAGWPDGAKLNAQVESALAEAAKAAGS